MDFHEWPDPAAGGAITELGPARLLRDAHAAMIEFQQRLAGTLKEEAEDARRQAALLKGRDLVAIRSAVPEAAQHIADLGRDLKDRALASKMAGKTMNDALKHLGRDLGAAAEPDAPRGDTVPASSGKSQGMALPTSTSADRGGPSPLSSPPGLYSPKRRYR